MSEVEHHRRIDVLAIEQFAEIAIHAAFIVAVFLVGHFLDRRATTLFNIAHGEELDVRLFQVTWTSPASRSFSATPAPL